MGHLNRREMILAEKRRKLKEKFGGFCFYCSRNFSDRLDKLVIHHRDYLGYLELPKRNPYSSKLVRITCSECHTDVHIAASAITLGLVRSIPINAITRILAGELRLNRNLIIRVKHELKRIGISEYEIGYSDDSLVCRILLHAMVEDYIDELEMMFEEEKQLAASHLVIAAKVPSN